jgi:DNA-binding NarL/FixJ family response regulator
MLTLLLADDHCSMRAVLRRIVQYDSRLALIGEAGNLRQALALSAEFRPSVLLLDLHMPDQRDFDPPFVKQQLATSCGSVFAMSVWQDPESEQLARSYGALCLLDKAYFATQLPAAIDSLAQVNRAHFSAAAVGSTGPM